MTNADIKTHANTNKRPDGRFKQLLPYSTHKADWVAAGLEGLPAGVEDIERYEYSGPQGVGFIIIEYRTFEGRKQTRRDHEGPEVRFSKNNGQWLDVETL